jgi:hypothetical protein
MGKTTDGQEPGLVSNGRRLFLLGMAGTAVVLSGCGGGHTRPRPTRIRTRSRRRSHPHHSRTAIRRVVCM